MLASFRKIFLKNEQGQSLFEFIIFLPFLLVLFAVYNALANSINGSINQQKAVRGYYWFLVGNNSYMPLKSDLERVAPNNFMGLFAIGWRDRKLDGDVPGAPCYELKTVVPADPNDSCDDSIDGSTTTNFIRIYTVYGACGASWRKTEGTYVEAGGDLRGSNACGIN